MSIAMGGSSNLEKIVIIRGV